MLAKGSRPWFNDIGIIKVTKVDKPASGQVTVTCDDNVTSMFSMFYGCGNLTSIDLSSFDTSNVENMLSMFERCGNLTTIKGVIDMKSCTEFYGNMFANCPNLRGVKIKNPPSDFERYSGLSKSQYTIVS